jgi:hypothetical protein
MNNAEQIQMQDEMNRLQREEENRRMMEALMRQKQMQQQQSMPSGMNPGMAMNAMSGGGGGSAAGGSAAGGGAAGGGGGGGSALAAAGPWAALAAAIIGNESMAKKNDKRGRASGGEYVGDLLTGKVLEQDASYAGDKIGGPIGKMVEIGGEMGNPEGMLKNAKKALMPWEWF